MKLVSQLVLSEVIYSSTAYYDHYKFTSKYNKEAVFTAKDQKCSWKKSYSLLGCLFFKYDHLLPGYIQNIFKPFAAEPPAFKISAIEQLLEGTSSRSSQLSAIKELQAILQLIELKPLKVSDKTNMPSAGTVAILNKIFEGGSYYQGDKVEDICAVGWVLLQAAKLVKRRGTTLELTPKGKKALKGDHAYELKNLWECWLNNKILDEFKRIHNIKGQSSKAMRRAYTDPFERRQMIESLLKILPANVWISIDDVSQAALAHNFDFRVTLNEAWGLYIVDSQYGNLGGYGNTWPIVEMPYLLCVLFEYAATLGIIDIGYTSPVNKRSDQYSSIWGADQHRFISRYDGLTHIRITDLGSYMLGNSEFFEMQLPKTTITISEQNIIDVKSMLISVELKNTLDFFAKNIAEQQWQLSEASIASALKNGAKLTTLTSTLNSYDVKIPLLLSELFESFTQNKNKLKLKDKLFLYECESSSLENTIIRNKSMSYAIRADERLIAIPEKKQEKFSAEMLKLKIII